MAHSQRLSHADFSLILKAKIRRVHGLFFSLSVGEVVGVLGPKAACVVSKKVSLRAVDRNVVKRRCREVVRAQLRGTGALPHCDQRPEARPF